MRLDLMIIMGSIIIIIINIIIIRVLLYFLQLSFNLLNIWCFFFFVSILQTLIIMNTTNHLNGSETRCFFFCLEKEGMNGGKKERILNCYHGISFYFNCILLPSHVQIIAILFYSTKLCKTSLSIRTSLELSLLSSSLH